MGAMTKGLLAGACPVCARSEKPKEFERMRSSEILPLADEKNRRVASNPFVMALPIYRVV